VFWYYGKAFWESSTVKALKVDTPLN